MADNKNKTIFQRLTMDEILDFRFRQKYVSFDNPLSIFLSKKSLLNEGLINTYPIDKTIKYIKDLFQLSSNNIYKIKSDNGCYSIHISFPFVEENFKLIDKSFDFCGYYFATVVNEFFVDEVRWLTLQYEPKFQKDCSYNIRLSENHLYHITLNCYEQSILKNGLCPKSKNKLFSYPNRIYFVKGSCSDETLIRLTRMLNSGNNNIHNNGIYSIFDVDLNLIPKNIKIFYDNNYIFGLYITDNISPKCIKKIGNLNINQHNPQIIWNKKIKEF